MTRLVAVLAVVALVLGACTDDAPSSSSDGSSSSSSSSADGSSTTAASGSTATTLAEGLEENGLPPVDGPFAAGRTPIPGFGEVEVRIVEGPDGETIVLCVLVADTPEQRARGLMEVTDLGGYDGMLFRFEASSDGGFWMKDTLLPLSLAYLDAEGGVVSTADMDPCPEGTVQCPSYPADGPFRMALEVPQGGLAPLGLVEGSPARLEVTGAACPPSTDAT